MFFIVFAIAKLPKVKGEEHTDLDILGTIKRLVSNGKYMDGAGLLSLSATRVSFVLPFICFVTIAIYGYRTYSVH